MLVKPVCPNCQRFFRPKRNGQAFTEMMPKAQGALPGDQTPELWQPYKVWVGDLWECHGCGAEIIVGVVGGPVAEHFQDNFEQWQTALAAKQVLVNDC